MTAREALSKIRSGDRVFLGSGCAEPQCLLNDLVELGGEGGTLNDVEIVHLLTFGTPRHVAKRFDRNFRHNSFFVGPGVREAVRKGEADYTPIFLSEIPALLRKGLMHLDAALVQVSPPDEHGFCSFGVSVEAHHAAIAAADYVVAQINPQMPRTLGDSFVHIDQLDALVECNEPLLEVPPEAFDPPPRVDSTVVRLTPRADAAPVDAGLFEDLVQAAFSQRRKLLRHTLGRWLEA
ncbi:MAG: hypothetical protein M1423_03860, partial [Acidobacteria bacterium]|nr:hypothetical protein [Acidobacteriota bacterium]